MVKNYNIISQDYPQITIEDFNQHLKYDFVDLKIFRDDSYIAGLYTTTQVYGEAIVGYTNGLRIAIELSTTNTGDITINIANIGIKKLFAIDGISQVPAGFIVANQRYYAEYDITLDGGSGAFKLASKNEDELLSEEAFFTIQSAYNIAENYTKRTLTRTTFEIDWINEITLGIIELRKSPFIQVNSITIDGSSYDLNNVVIDDTKYPYATIDFDNKKIDSATINFDAGYIELPSGLKNAVLQLIAFLYSNRGDCSMSKLPSYISCLLNGYKLISL